MNTRLSVDLSVPLHAAPDDGLRRMWQVVLHAQAAITAHLRLLTLGRDVPLLTVAQALREGATTAVLLPDLPPDALSHAVAPTTRAYQRAFRHARDALGWGEAVPASALAWMVRATLREWREQALRGPVPFSSLPNPWPPSRPAELHVDQGLLLVDPVTVEVARIGRLHADVRLLPDPYWDALWQQRQRRVQAEQARLRAAEQAWLDQGDVQASALALRLRARYAAAGLPLDAAVEPEAPEPQGPAVTERVVIRAVERPGEAPRWEVGWRFRVDPHRVPRWTVDDVIGIDPGYDSVAGCASAHVRALIPRPVSGAWQLPALPSTTVVPVSAAHEAQARAEHRRALIERMRPAYAQLHRLALAHRAIALEDTDWRGFEQQTGWFGRYAHQVGLRTTLEHLVALAPLHGVQLQLTPCSGSTMACSRCAWSGPRPRSGAPFHCGRCGHREHPDLNAAAVHRRRYIEGQGRCP